jgi:hypothetical protein
MPFCSTWNSMSDCLAWRKVTNPFKIPTHTKVKVLNETTTKNSYKQEITTSMAENMEDETCTFYLTKMAKGKLI